MEMDDDLVTNFVAAEPAPLSRSAERTKLRRLNRHKGLVSVLAYINMCQAPSGTVAGMMHALHW